MPQYVVFVFKTKEAETNFLASLKEREQVSTKQYEPYAITTPKPNKRIAIPEGSQFHLSWEARGSNMFQLFKRLCKQNPELTRDQIETTVHLGYIPPANTSVRLMYGYWSTFEYLNRIDRIYEFHNWADRHPGFAGQKETPNKLQLETRNRLLHNRVDKLEFELEEHKDRITQLERHINKLESGQPVVS